MCFRLPFEFDYKDVEFKLIDLDYLFIFQLDKGNLSIMQLNKDIIQTLKSQTSLKFEKICLDLKYFFGYLNKAE